MQQPSFDTWTTIFLFAAIQGLFVATVLFFVKRKEFKANSLLALLIFLFSITLIEYVLYWTGYIYFFPHVMSLSDGFPFLFGVILYFYFEKIFEGHQLSKKDYLHFLPFLLYLVYMMPRYLSAAEVKQMWILGKSATPSWFVWPLPIRNIQWLHWVKIAHMLVYLVVIFKRFYIQSKSNREITKWFNWLTGLFAGFIFSYASYFVLVRFSFFNQEWDYLISFSMMFTIYFIAWFGYLQPRVFSGFTLAESVSFNGKYKNAELPDDVSTEILSLLENLMATRYLYRESDLRLEKLASETGTSRHHLSQVINNRLGMNFFEYINSLRITEAMELLKDKGKSRLTIIEVAYQVGFNNKVSFNAAFKKQTGVTPTEYRKQHLNAAEPEPFV